MRHSDENWLWWNWSTGVRLWGFVRHVKSKLLFFLMQVNKLLVNAIMNREYLFDCLPVFFHCSQMERERTWIKSVQDMNVQRGGFLTWPSSRNIYATHHRIPPPSLDSKAVWLWPLSLDHFSAYVPATHRHLCKGLRTFLVVCVVGSDLYVMKPQSLSQRGWGCLG